MQKHDFVIQNQINQHWVLFPSHWATILIQQKITRHRCCLKPNQDLLALVLRPRKVSVPHSKMSNLMLATKLLYSHILKQTGFPSYKKFQVYTPLFLHTNFPGNCDKLAPHNTATNFSCVVQGCNSKQHLVQLVLQWHKEMAS